MAIFKIVLNSQTLQQEAKQKCNPRTVSGAVSFLNSGGEDKWGQHAYSAVMKNSSAFPQKQKRNQTTAGESKVALHRQFLKMANLVEGIGRH